MTNPLTDALQRAEEAYTRWPQTLPRVEDISLIINTLRSALTELSERRRADQAVREAVERVRPLVRTLAVELAMRPSCTVTYTAVNRPELAALETILEAAHWKPLPSPPQQGADT